MIDHGRAIGAVTNDIANLPIGTVLQSADTNAPAVIAVRIATTETWFITGRQGPLGTPDLIAISYHWRVLGHLSDKPKD